MTDANGSGRQVRRRTGKSSAAFRTISEVATELDVPAHVLRFWETKFPSVRPLKRGGGRRYYRPEDVELLRGIRTLLYEDGYTIKGVQKLLKENSGKLPLRESIPASSARDGGMPQYELALTTRERVELANVLEELKDLRRELAHLAAGSAP